MIESKLLVVGDSLAAERKENDEAIVVWPDIVANVCSIEVRNLSKPFQISHVLQNVKPSENLVILSLGLVDCAERSYSRLEAKMLARLPKGVAIWVKLLLNRVPAASRCYVDIDEFIENYRNFIDDNSDKKFLLVGILPSSLQSNLSHVTRHRISLYNDAIKNLATRCGVEFLDTSEMVDKRFYVEDGYHLSKCGHEVLASKIGAWIASEK